MNGIAAPLRRRLAIVGLVLGSVLLAPAAANAACPERSMAQEFARWLDPINYTIVPGGHFEGSLAGWSLSGGAKIVSGNEPFYLRSGGDDQSLYLPAGSSARTPFVCVELLDSVSRFVSRNRGSLLGVLEVDALIRTSSGTVAVPAGIDAVSSSWHPSLPMLVASNLLAGLDLENGTAEVAYRFRPAGFLSAWQIDDVYVDPFRSR